MDHDGGVDDYLATMLLLTMEHIELLGVVVTSADCYLANPDAYDNQGLLVNPPTLEIH